jgi:hypothetical protein
LDSEEFNKGFLTFVIDFYYDHIAISIWTEITNIIIKSHQFQLQREHTWPEEATHLASPDLQPS